VTNPNQAFARDGAAARQYAACVVPYLLGPWIPDLISWADLQKGDRVLDLACGTGAVTRAAAAMLGSSGRVTGLDISSEMLDVAKQTLFTIVPAIQWQLGDAGSMPFVDATFDVVLCQQGLQFFTDRRLAVAEIRRVLAPRGRFVSAVWSRIENNPYYWAVAAAADRHLGEEAGRQFRSSFALGEPSEFRSALNHSVFKSVEIRTVAKRLKLPPLPELIPQHFAGTLLANLFASTAGPSRAALITDVVRRLRINEPENATVLRLEVHLALAQ